MRHQDTECILFVISWDFQPNKKSPCNTKNTSKIAAHSAHGKHQIQSYVCRVQIRIVFTLNKTRSMLIARFLMKNNVYGGIKSMKSTHNKT